jgi:hypothetical protein
LRIFDSTGAEIAVSDDDLGPGTEKGDLESFLVFTAPVAGTYYVGVSTYDNFAYDAITGDGDANGFATGTYELMIKDAPILLEFVVNTVADTSDANLGDFLAEDSDGNTSLRSAIQELNAIADDNTIAFIDFAIDTTQLDPVTGRFVTRPATPLPAFTKHAQLSTGGLQANNYPPFQIDGSNVSGAATDGVRVANTSISLSGIVVSNFPGDGLDLTGADYSWISDIFAYDNLRNGIRVNNTQDARISYSDIFDNGLAGILLTGATTTGTVIESNNIGVEGGGFQSSPAGNGTYGIQVLSPNNILVNNVVAGNANIGIAITSADASGNLLLGNRVGTDYSDSTGLANGSYGILVKSPGNRIGGDSSFNGNVISGNQRSGLVLSGSAATGNTILGNFIGTDGTGSNALPNGAYGILVSDAMGNTIGSSNPAERNVISGNSGAGIALATNSSSNTIQGNYIGIDATGFAGLGNGSVGVYLRAGANNNELTGNYIATNNGSQVTLVGNTTTANRFTGNYIGFGQDFTQLSGGANAMFIASPGNIIGGPAATDRNYITGSNNGITVSGLAAKDNVIQNNGIGVDAAIPPNSYGMINGVQFLQGANDNTLGPGNTIAYNTGDAVRSIGAAASEGNKITQNSIFANGFGIDLGANGPNANDTGDADAGPNRLQNSASSVVVSATQELNGFLTIDIDYSIDSDPTNSAYPLTVEFFIASDGQGAEYVAFDTYTTADFANGSASYSILVNGADFTFPADFGTATVTDADGNTSEFTLPVPIAFGTNSTAFGAPPASNPNPQRTNLALAEDVNFDGFVTPLDALLIINKLNSTAEGEQNANAEIQLLDTNGDGQVTALDALIVINYLNLQSGSPIEEVMPWIEDEEELVSLLAEHVQLDLAFE